MFQIITLAVIAVLTGLDMLIKAAVTTGLSGGERICVIPHVISLQYTENYNGMWGMFEGKRDLLSVVTAVIIAAGIVVLLLRKIKPMFASCCITAVIAGGLGNLIDRIRLGYVVDYIATDFINFPTYNFADCLITVGCFALMGYEIYEIIRDGRKKKDA